VFEPLPPLKNQSFIKMSCVFVATVAPTWRTAVVFVAKELGMAMGRGGNRFCHPRPHPLIPFTYPLPYPYPTGMRN